MNRRAFLKWGVLTTATSAAFVACQSVPTEEGPTPTMVTPLSTQPHLTPTEGAPFESDSNDLLLRLMNRAGYGPRPGELDAAAEIGFEAYLDAQLDPESIPDPYSERLVEAFPLMNLTSEQIDGDLMPNELAPALFAGAVMRKIGSTRQLYEAMVEFWGDHFHIYIRKNRRLFAFKLIDDREVIRPHALGNFKALLRASIYSPAMLVYLDNYLNTADDPNENYARELLELHTLGVNGGYLQADVDEVARVLSGVTLNRQAGQRGVGRFNPRIHDDTSKIVMGERFPAGQGEADIDQLITLLAEHPSTARFITTKLIRRFVNEQPPAELVESTSALFLETGGEIKPLLRHIFMSDEFASAPPKLKRPLDSFVSAARALADDVRFSPSMMQWLAQMGHTPFLWPAPNGYPDQAEAWTGTLLARWNFMLALAGDEIDGVTLRAIGGETPESYLDTLSRALFNRPLNPNLEAGLRAYLNEEFSDATRAEAAALVLASPAFMWK